jgi:hypothetical protein
MLLRRYGRRRWELLRRIYSRLHWHTVKILFTGKGSSGSWSIRGTQIAEGLRDIGVDALAIPKASVEQLRWADVVVLVKRPNAEIMAAIWESQKPLVWDIVDAWTQPEGNEWPRERCLSWLATQLYYVKPDAIICATRAMQDDAEFAKSCVIYHHARPELTLRRRHGVFKKTAEWFVYDGGDHYLGRYRDILIERSGMTFARGYLGDFQMCADVIVCLRDSKGYAPRHWKSNVKLANAQALGIPALCSPESGYKETSTGGVLWIESPSDLPAAFDALANPARYAELCAAVDAPPTLREVAVKYRAFLESII